MTGARRLRLLLTVGACALLAATFAKPELTLTRPTYRYVFVFDITQSMNVADVPAAQTRRLDYTKQAASTALAALPCGTEVGLALFAGHRAFLLVTPVETCANYHELVQVIDGIEWRMSWEARSEVAKGLFKSVELLAALGRDTRLVFFSDGQEAPPINPDVPPRFDGEAGTVAGLVVGVGGDTPVPIPRFDDEDKPLGVWHAHEVLHTDTFTADQRKQAGERPLVGTEHLSSLREAYLQQLAAKTGLGYHRLQGGDDLLRALEQPALGIPRAVSTDMRWLVALIALVAFLASHLVGRTRDRASATTR
ncbi:MAG: vWA domain-containing protein [Gammaproteobacteria bacterium]